VDTNEKVVALTFDDAPSEYSDAVLKILLEKNINATFYCVGKNIEEFPEEMQNIIASGNEIGNHSYSHQRMIFKTPAYIKNEINKTNNLIRESGYRGEITFRPPNGKKILLLPWYLNNNNIKTIMWDVEPDTYFEGNTEEIIRYTLENTKPGSIILMHPFCGNSCEADREALPKIIDGLKANGYDFVTVSQLIEKSSK
jgi:chitin deacetylase